MLQPLSSDKEELAKKILDEDARSNILSLPSNATEDIVALSDIPIMEVKEELTLEPPVTKVMELAEETVVNTASEENESEAQINSAIRFKKPKGSAYVFIQMKLVMKASGKIIKNMEKVNIFIQMVKYMKVIGKKMYVMVMVNIFIQIVTFMKVIGKMINIMVMVN